MPAPCISPSLDRSATDHAERADANFRANLAALAARQPALDTTALTCPADLIWINARDGALTGMFDGTRWWAGCSVPLAAARFMLKSMEIRGTTGCFLNPRHAAQLRVALDILHSRQAVIAIVPEQQMLAVLLHTDDFAQDIASGRLWFAGGSRWESQLETIFRDNPGLATPAEFIRPITSDADAANALIEPAQRTFSQISAARGAQSKSLIESWQPGARAHLRLCLLAPSEFRLWDDAALVLDEMDFSGTGIKVDRLDSDRPTSSSPLALARSASQCDAIAAANIFRSHLPGVVPTAMPWVTWVTTPRIPPAADAGPNDRLILADAYWVSIAKHLGWEACRLEVAGWPALPRTGKPESILSLIADTHLLDVPKPIEGYSSQVLLWETIRDELIRDPFLAVDNIDGYLNSRRARFQIGDDGFDRSIFKERLIVPAVQQGLARRLIKDGMPLRLFGRGWDSLDRMAQFHGGPVRSRQELAGAVSQSAALVHVWPWQAGHAIELTGRPVIRTKRMHEFLSDVRQAMNGTLIAPSRHEPIISPELIARVIRAERAVH